MGLVDFHSGFNAGFMSSGDEFGSVSREPYSCALGGRRYLIDESGNFDWKYGSVPLLDPNSSYLANTLIDETGEATTNRTAGWRRTVKDWSKGAGQTHLDFTESDSARFRSSLNVNPWERWELSLLDYADAGPGPTYTRLVSAGDLVFWCDDTLVYRIESSFIVDHTTFNGWSGVFAPSSPPLDLTSDGELVYVATSGGVETWDGFVIGSHSATAAEVIAWAKSRIIAGQDSILYEMLPATPATTLLDTGIANWTWDAIADGDTQIFAVGWDGVRSNLYGIGIESDGSTLSAPTPINTFPNGERVYTLQTYLGFVLIGTSLGVRLAQEDANGKLVIGSLIEAGTVTDFAAWGSFVWFTWSNHTTDPTGAVWTGLGRLDMRILNGDAPAYATDLAVKLGDGGLVGSTGEVGRVCVAPGSQRLLFLIESGGIGVQMDTPADVGWVDSGEYTWSLSDPKLADWLRVDYDPIVNGEVVAYIIADGVETSLGTVPDTGQVSAQQARGRRLETRLKLLPSTDPLEESVIVHSWTVSVRPTPKLAQQFTVPLQIEERDFIRQTEYGRDVAEELQHFRDLRSSQATVRYQARGWSAQVTVTDFEYRPRQGSEDNASEPGVCLVLLTTVV